MTILVYAEVNSLSIQILQNKLDCQYSRMLFGMRLQKQFSFQSKEQYQNLAFLASLHGFKSVSAFVQAIADEQILLGRAALSLPEQQAMLAGVSALTKSADLKSARTLTNFALNNLQLKEVIAQLDEIRNAITSPWIMQIEEFIAKQQSFGLSYQDAAGSLWAYTAHYAKINYHEKRYYLECWCEETGGNRDCIAELQHNWTLRLDRIVDAGIVPIDGEWRSGLDEVAVEFDLLGGLAHAYQQRPNDNKLDWISSDPPIIRVVRQISNSFWFVREILSYGKDCIVRSPQILRQTIKEHFKATFSLYTDMAADAEGTSALLADMAPCRDESDRNE